MAGLEDVNIIDLVAQDADGRYMLVMIENRPWGSDPAQPAQLQEKMNTYAGYVLDGSLASQYPETAGHPIRIRLDCGTQPTPEISEILSYTAPKLHDVGMTLVINVR